MSSAVEFKQTGHLDPALLDPAAAANVEKLLGRWANTNRETGGIAECEIQRDGDQFSIQIFGAGDDDPIAWPLVRTKALANLEEEAGQRTIALAANFNFGFMKSEIYIRVNKGVLVIVLYNTFLDDSGRSNYLNREFFYRVS
ncbi:MAG TPA: hypothetical protein VFI24_06185 [Pyrinomonadaceae bacterium]|nr:hypothetical protein [Pyrinomonadaceae bacterium]